MLAIVYFASGKTKSVKAIVGVIVLIVVTITGSSDSFAFWESDLTYEGESVYQKSDTLTGMYYDYAMAAPMMADVHGKDSLDVLILGMGTGTFATQCDRYFDGICVEGVEIDEDITKLAREYFHLSEDTKVHTYDGRAFLNAIDQKYDVIMVDAYQDITIPFQMSSVEFFYL